MISGFPLYPRLLKCFFLKTHKGLDTFLVLKNAAHLGHLSLTHPPMTFGSTAL